MVEQDIVSYRILSPQEIWELANQAKDVRSKEYSIPYSKNNLVYDVKLHGRGFQEDKIFTNNPELLYNIRRGLSLIVSNHKLEKYDPSNNSFYLIESRQIDWARKGMFKFFDMYISFVQHDNNTQIDQTGTFTKKFEECRGKEKQRILMFGELEDTILHKGGSVLVYQTIKANGENAQVSFNAPLNSWIIASKNVCLAAVTREDLDSYGDERYKFAKLIAQRWFDFLDRLPAEKQESLKRDLAGYTIIGEFVGDPNYQHLIKYYKVTLLFYALVKNDSSYNSEPPLKAFNLFRKYGLECVDSKLIGEYDKLSEFYKTLEQIYKKIASESLEEGEEGSVLYFVKNFGMRSDNIDRAERRLFRNEECEYDEQELIQELSNQQTVSLCKLKTLEYRILRKLREKIKKIDQERNTKSLYDEFLTEVLELKDNYELPQPLEYYKTLAKEALEKAAHYKEVKGGVQNRYITFLEHIKSGASLDGIFIDKVDYTPVCDLSVVLCTPPLMYNETELKELCYDLGLSGVDKRWKDLSKEKIGDEKIKLHYLVDLPKTSDSFHKNALLVFVGYSERWVEDTVERAKIMDAQTVETLKKTTKSYSREYNPLRLNRTNSQYHPLIKHLQTNFEDYILVSEEKPDHKTLLQLIRSKLQHISGSDFIPPIPEESKVFDIQALQEEEKVPIPISLPILPETKPVLKDHDMTYVIIPMGIPGMGKSNLISSFREIVEELGCTMDVVSSDVVRQECMKEYMEKNPTAKFDQAFDKTRNAAKMKFDAEIRRSLDKDSDHHVLFIDKNHPPNAIKGTLELLSKFCPYGRKLRIAALIPECKDNIVISGHNNYVSEYPFSYEFLTQCLLRVKDRVMHETLQGTIEKKFEVIFFMFKMYKNVLFSDYIGNGFHSLISVPFTYEGNIGITEELKDLINSVILSRLSGKGEPVESLDELVRYVTQTEFRLRTFDPSPKLKSALYNFFGIINPSINMEPEEPYKKPTRHVETSHSKPIAKKSHKHPNKIPVYIGIALEESLGSSLTSIIFHYLSLVCEQFPAHSHSILPDLEELSSHRDNPFISGAKLSEHWSFTRSLHLTTLFIGGNSKQLTNPIYQAFEKGKQVMLQLKHFVYVPRKIITASAEILTTEVESSNEIPHVTLLLGSLSAKFSNDVLKGIHNFSRVFESQIFIKGEQALAFGVAFEESLILTGEYKDFY
jgi:hypothetical protein